MEELPFPSNWRGWLLALALGVLLYPLYYLHAYPPIERRLVFDRYEVARYTVRHGEKEVGEVSVRYFPSVSTFAASDMFVAVESPRAVTDTLRLRVRAEYVRIESGGTGNNGEGVSPTIQWGCAEHTNNLQCDPQLSNFIFDVGRASSQARRISYVAIPGSRSLSKKDKFNFTLEGEGLTTLVLKSGDEPQVTYNPTQVFVSQVLVRGVLVPPWSNVLLLGGVLLVTEALEEARRELPGCKLWQKIEQRLHQKIVRAGLVLVGVLLSLVSLVVLGRASGMSWVCDVLAIGLLFLSLPVPKEALEVKAKVKEEVESSGIVEGKGQSRGDKGVKP